MRIKRGGRGDSLKNAYDLKALEIYGNSHGVIVDKMPIQFSNGSINSYLKALAVFHKNMSGSDIRSCRLPSSIGKEIEKIKWDSKIVRRFIKNTLDSSEEGALKEFFREYGNIYSEVTLKIVETFNDNRYLNIIKRSMDREEICLIDASCYNISPCINLQDNDMKSNVCVRNLEDCCYNLVEIDYGNFVINSHKKFKGAGINLNSIIDYIIYIENLDDYSKEFILSYVNYPYKFTKDILRFVENKREWNENELVSRLMKTRKRDKSLMEAVESIG